MFVCVFRERERERERERVPDNRSDIVGVPSEAEFCERRWLLWL